MVYSKKSKAADGGLGRNNREDVQFTKQAGLKQAHTPVEARTNASANTRQRLGALTVKGSHFPWKTHEHRTIQ